MRTIPPALLVVLGQQTMNTCWCAVLSRSDGVQLGFTEHDRPLLVSGVMCEPASGANISALSSSADMSVDNSDMLAFLRSESITENDLMRGVYDGAKLQISLVDWSNLAAGEVVLASGVLGEISAAGESFTAEFRSLTQSLQQTIGRKVGIECDVSALGDARCGVDLPAYTHIATVVTVADPLREFTIDYGGSDPTYFSYGTIEWTNGDGRNTQKGTRVSDWDDATNTVVVAGTTVDDVQVGDTMLISAGCDRRGSTCRSRFSNYVNFQGFPYVPGRDDAAETPDAK